MKRRQWLLSGLGVAGALVVGWGALPPRSRLGGPDMRTQPDTPVALNGWLKVLPDGRVELAMPRCEMGQGVHTALATLVAEEMDLPLARVALAEAGSDAIFGNIAALMANLPLHPRDLEPGQETGTAQFSRWMIGKVGRELGIVVTGGSSSVADAWEVLRLAAATARARLLGAASLQWKLPLDELEIREGVISHAAGPQAHFGELARAAAATPVVRRIEPKAPQDWRLIGFPVPRTDVPAKVEGRAGFGMDVRLPDMVYAVVRHSPALGGSPGRVDVKPAMALPGVERVVRLGPYAGSTAALAVVGRSTWHAQRGAQALEVEWRVPPAGTVRSADIAMTLERLAREAAQTGGGFAFRDQGDAAQAAAEAARQIEAVYRAPYLPHLAMEPINCTAMVRDGRVTLWAPTQASSAARQIAAQVAEVDEDAVTLHTTYVGGGFGRRLEVDHIGQAVRIALETGGRPVQMVWPREEDATHDFYRPAAAAVMQASLDAEGQVTGLRVTTAGDAVVPRYLARNLPQLAGPVDTPDKTCSEGLIDQAYEIAHQHVAHVATHSGVPVGYWRSVGHSHNAFFYESFVDELAHAVGRDPVAFRLDLLRHSPRHAEVLRRAADKAGWGQPLAPGRARGVALHESFGSIVAQVAEVSVVAGHPRVHRVVCAADVGTVVNPGIVAQQFESAVIFALSAALYGRIDIEGSVVAQANFDRHPVVRLAESPRIEVHLLPSTRAPAGVGEPGVPPLAPAVANALFTLTGQRLRALPLALG